MANDDNWRSRHTSSSGCTVSAPRGVSCEKSLTKTVSKSNNDRHSSANSDVRLWIRKDLLDMLTSCEVAISECEKTADEAHYPEGSGGAEESHRIDRHHWSNRVARDQERCDRVPVGDVDSS